MRRIGIIVGHSQENQGMSIYNGQSEFSFNLEVAHIIRVNLSDSPDFDISVFYRKGRHYHRSLIELAAALSSEGIFQAYELHLNAFDSRTAVRGHEILINRCDRLPSTKNRAAQISNSLQKNLEIWPRHNSGVREIKEGDRGFWNMEYLRRCGISSMLLEPCFADVRHKDSEKIVEYPERYASLLSDVISTDVTLDEK